MTSQQPTPEQKLDLEARVLLSALKGSIERGDVAGANLAHKELSKLLATRTAGSGATPPEAVRRVDEVDSETSGTATASSLEAAAAGKSGPGEGQPAGSAEAEHEESRQSPEWVPIGDLYEILGVDPMSSIEEIHVQYLRHVRKLLVAQQLTRDTSVWDFRGRLRLLSIAHDVLKDPVTKTDYDFRLLGLRGETAPPAPDLPGDMRTTVSGTRPGLRIGELLQASDILEATDLEMAIDMHKAMPELPFGQFLVRQEFLSQDELDSALLGQRLIVDGKITVAQFQVAMFSVRSDGVPLGETLKARGWVGEIDVKERLREDPWAARPLPANQPPPVEAPPPITEIAPKPADADSRRPPAIEAGNALPSWADELEWEEADDSSDAAGSAETSFESDLAEPPADLEAPIVAHESDDTTPGLAARSLAGSLEEALAAEIHRLERETSLPRSRRSGIEDATGSGQGSPEPALDVGEVEPPPFPAEAESATQPPAAKRKSRESAGDKAGGHSGAPDNGTLSTDLDDDVE